MTSAALSHSEGAGFEKGKLEVKTKYQKKNWNDSEKMKFILSHTHNIFTGDWTYLLGRIIAVLLSRVQP